MLMTLTTAFIAERFNKYNNEYFDGKLKTPKFAVNRTKTQLGCFTHSRYGRTRISDTKITISEYYDRTIKQYDETIIHEMIHLYIYQFDIHDTSTHGVRFYQECKRINKFGWNLSRCTSTEGWEVNTKYKRASINVFIYRKKTDGKFFMMASNENYVEKYQKYFERSKDNLAYYKFFKTTNVDKFKDLPLCRGGFRGFYINKSQVEEYSSCAE